jgi:2'-5' RNA ligase
VSALRAFIAIELPAPVRQAVAAVQECLKSEGVRLRWVRPENIHLTLKFLGQTPVDAVDALSCTLDAAAQATAPFELAIQGLGAFPGIRRPKVVWTGVGGDLAALQQLHRKIDSSVAAVDRRRFPEDNRPFKAHLTLGRVKGRIDSRPLSEAVQKCRGPRDSGLRVAQFGLIKSVLTPQGPRYTTLERFALRGR